MINLRRSMRSLNKGVEHRKKTVKRFSHNHTTLDVVENLAYELKPIVYFFFSVVILRVADGGDHWVKFGSVGILAFSLYIIYSRMVYRGLLGG